jgi:hypothetical protein
MRRLVPALCAVALTFAVAAPARAQGAPPAALPAGDGRDMLATACSQCHTLAVIRSMREGPEGWKRHVYNMVTRGAQLTAHEADTVIAYLATNFGPTAAPAAGRDALHRLPRSRTGGDDQAPEGRLADARRQHGRSRRGGDARGGADHHVLSGGAFRRRVNGFRRPL